MRTAGVSTASAGFSAVMAAGDSRLSLGPPALDRALGGGLCLQRLHEIVPEGVFQLGSAAGFALALAPRGRGAIVWIQQGLAALEGGAPYGLGGTPFGIAPARLLIVQAAAPRDALWAMEESLRCDGIAAVIGELSGAGEAADLTATRRLNLVLQEQETLDRGSLGLLLRHQPLKGTSACATRWHVRAAPGSCDGLGGIGRTALALSLVKNQRGPCGDWQVEWDNDEQCFRAALPVAVAAPAAGRPHRAA
jgi:protein ImuA